MLGPKLGGLLITFSGLNELNYYVRYQFTTVCQAIECSYQIGFNTFVVINSSWVVYMTIPLTRSQAA